jgi:hypothetical protein
MDTRTLASSVPRYTQAVAAAEIDRNGGDDVLFSRRDNTTTRATSSGSG